MSVDVIGIKFLKNEFLEEEHLILRKERLEGEINHYLLSMIENLEDEEKTFDELWEKIFIKTQSVFGKRINSKYYYKKIRELVENIKIKQWFFFKERVDILNEQEIVDKFGITKRIDRFNDF